MKRLVRHIALDAVVLVTVIAHPAAFQSAIQRHDQRPQPEITFVKGTVVRVYAPRLFSIRPTDEQAEFLVLAPRELSTVEGATVAVSGTVARSAPDTLSKTPGWADLDAAVRTKLVGERVIVATAVLSTLEPQAEQTESREEPQAVATAGSPAVEAHGAAAAPLVLRSSVLVDFIDSFAGQQVRVRNARVVGVIAPTAFIIEPATRYLKEMGRRDRLVVFIERGTLRVSPDVLVGSIIGLDGTARTLLSLRASSDVAWPERLTPEAIERLEVRAAILATSVHTAEGTELTQR